MKKRNATSPGQRFIVSTDRNELTKKVKPLKRLTSVKAKIDGRDGKGRVSVRHRGGGRKRKYRFVDFNQKEFGEKAKVETIEYDPNRTGNIARIVYDNGIRCYILAIDGLKVGDSVQFGEKVPIKTGNRMALMNIPTGTSVCNVELVPDGGGVLARSAGTSVQLAALDRGKAQLVLSSGEIRIVKEECMATLGIVGNKEHHNIKIGKAGANRYRGKRPVVRGAAMNPCDHPHGGGEGKAPIGRRKGPSTPWGKLARGVKTRHRKRYSNKLIIKKRK